MLLRGFGQIPAARCDQLVELFLFAEKRVELVGGRRRVDVIRDRLAAFAQRAEQAIAQAPAHAHGELIEDMHSVRGFGGQAELVHVGERSAVGGGDLAARVVPALDVRELHAQQRCLKPRTDLHTHFRCDLGTFVSRCGLLKGLADRVAIDAKRVERRVPSAVAMLKQRPNFVVVPNLPDRGVAQDMSWLSSALPEDQVRTLQAASTDRPDAQAFFAIQARNIERLAREGVTIALGTDGNVPWGPHLEMADMVAAGMTPAQVLTAATKNAAEFLRIPNAGTVASGNSADFIVLDANPLDDIRNTRRIDRVILRGHEVGREGMRARWAAACAAAGRS